MSDHGAGADMGAPMTPDLAALRQARLAVHGGHVRLEVFPAEAGAWSVEPSCSEGDPCPPCERVAEAILALVARGEKDRSDLKAYALELGDKLRQVSALTAELATLSREREQALAAMGADQAQIVLALGVAESRLAALRAGLRGVREIAAAADAPFGFGVWDRNSWLVDLQRRVVERLDALLREDETSG